MKDFKYYLLVFASLVLEIFSFAQNPFIRDQYTADPSARVFGDSVYVYPSHDVAGIEGKGRKGWFCMEDYHVFSSANLTNWNDHGVIVSQNKVEWVDSNAYSMWAPDCIYKNGKYYFYFPSIIKDTTLGKGFGVGVAISDKPYDPFIPEIRPIKNVHGIDPCPFIDKDGQAYLYWAARNIYVAKLKENMLELESDPKIIDSLPTKGLKEGPFVFERKGIYYLTYPHVRNKTECLEYAISNNPMGPYKVAGVIMDESPSGCWTDHQSFINFKDQWYLFYHNNDLSPKFDKNRSIRIDSLFFNQDGTIQKVTPTLRGVGITNASDKIQIDRYSQISDKGASVTFIDTLNVFDGWKSVFESEGAWIQYNSVDFGNKKYKSVQVKALSLKGSKLQVNLDKVGGTVIAEINITKSSKWAVTEAKLLKKQTEIHNLVIVLKDNNPVEIDWIQFMK